MAPTTDSNKYEKDHFILNRWILRGAGLWAPEKKSKFAYRAFNCYAVIVFLFVYLYFTPTDFMSLKDTYKNVNALIKNLSSALSHLLAFIKMLFWYFTNKNLRRIMNTLESEEFHYESTEDFQPSETFKKAKRTGIKYTFIFFVFANITVTSSYIPLIITTLTNPNYIENEHGNLTFFQSLPYYSWIPFNYDTPKSYLYALAYQVGPRYCYVCTVVGTDTLFTNIMNLIGTHLSVLKGAFRTIKNRCMKKMEQLNRVSKNRGANRAQLDTMMMKEFKRCVRHLQTIFQICDDLEIIYKFLTLMQALFTIFICCSCLFLVSTTPITSKGFASEMVYLFTICMQLMLYCWFGNEVTLKASEIPDSLWTSDWLDTHYSYRSNMLITMIRMRRPLYFTLGKFAPLTLNTFVSILRASYSFFAVLKNVNA